MHVQVCGCTCMCGACGHEFGSQRTLGIVPQLSSTLIFFFFFGGRSLTGLGTQQIGWPVSPRDLPVSASPALGL